MGVALVVFEGGAGASPVERQMAAVRRAIVLDTMEKTRSVPSIDRVLVVTDDVADRGGLGASAAAAGAEVVASSDGRAGGGGFHFGKVLRDVVTAYGLEKVICAGGGAMPLIAPAELEKLASLLATAERGVWANNIYSADVVGFAPASETLGGIELPASDNALGWNLREQAGLPELVLEPALKESIGLNFDVDTPVDLVVLSVHPACGAGTRAALGAAMAGNGPGWAGRCEAARRVIEVVNDPFSEMTVAGRVSSATFRYLDYHTKGRLRLFSEERGMKALGREEAGLVVSFVGHLIDRVGPRAFVELVAETSQALILDTRVLLAHRRIRASAEDRFLSDLGRWEKVREPWLAELTRVAAEAPVPVLLGGHSLVSGGLRALMDAAESRASGRSPAGRSPCSGTPEML